MQRVVRMGLGGLVIVVAALLGLQAVLARELERRLERAIDEASGIAGKIGDVSACLPCGSYTVHDLALRSAGASGPRPLLSARKLAVGLRAAALLGGRAEGVVVLRGATLDLDVGREAEGGRTALDVSWAEIGARLLPWPIDRVAVHDGALRVHHEGFETPVVWKLEAIEGRARDLQGRGGAEPHVRARGVAFGSGRFEVDVRLGGDGEPGFLLTGALHEVPLRALDTVLAQRAGLGVEGGRLDARSRIDGSATGWDGFVRCELTELDLFALGDLSRGPVAALRDALAGGVTSLATLGSDGPLVVRLDVEKRLGREGAVDPWQALALLVREALLVPFTVPIDVIAAAAEQLDPRSAEQEGVAAGNVGPGTTAPDETGNGEQSGSDAE